jgi:hypothetical protein
MRIEEDILEDDKRHRLMTLATRCPSMINGTNITVTIALRSGIRSSCGWRVRVDPGQDTHLWMRSVAHGSWSIVPFRI